MTVGNRFGCTTHTFSLESGLIRSMKKSNSAATGSLLLTVQGMSYGVVSSTTNLRIGFSACEMTNWLSDTGVRCMSCQGVRGTKAGTITLATLLGSSTAAYSTDLASVVVGRRTVSQNCTIVRSQAPFCNVHFDGLASASTWRISIDVINAEATVKGDGNCGKENSLVGSMLVPGTALINGTLNVKLDRRGVRTDCCLCNSDLLLARVTIVEDSKKAANMPRLAGMLLTISGSEIPGAASEAERVGGSACESTKWISHSVVICRVTTGHRAGRSLVLTAGERYVSASSGMSYDRPMLEALVGSGGALTGENLLTVIGVNFGQYSVSMRVKIGDSYLSNASWTSDSSISCRLNPLHKTDTQPGAGFRTDFAVLVEDEDSRLTDNGYPRGCQSISTWVDAQGRTCQDYAENIVAVRNTFDCAFSGLTLTGHVGALTDGVEPYGRNARCDWTLAPASSTTVTLSLTDLDLRVNDALMLYACSESTCSNMTGLGCAGCAVVSTTCPGQELLSGSYMFLQECYTFAPDGVFWDTCDGRPAYILTDRAQTSLQNYYLYYYAPFASWMISDQLGNFVPNAWVASDALNFSGIDSAMSGVQWYVNCNGSYTTSPGLLALSYTNTATFSAATSMTGVMKVKFTSAGCVTNPDWTDKNGLSCKTYIDNDFCNASNATGYGFGWEDNFGLERTFADYADAEGIDASQACCECTGMDSKDGFFARFASSVDSPILDPSSFEWTDWCRNDHYVKSHRSPLDNVTAPGACCECKEVMARDLHYEYACPTGYVRHVDTDGVYCQDINECADAAAMTCFLDFETTSCLGENHLPCTNTAGSFQCFNGSVPQCLSCGSGQYQSLRQISGGLTLPTCHDCPAGSDAPAGSTAITDCKCNRGYTGQNGEVCTACPAGKFKAVTAQPTDPCTDCAQGKYQPDQGKLFCFVCPPGTTSLSRATSAADCVAR